MLPLIARHLYRLQESLLRRKTFAVLAQLNESQWWPLEKLESLQYARLRRIAHLAYEHMPYWRRVMEERKILPDRLRSLDDLRRLPLLDKSMLQEHPDEMEWLEGGRRVHMTRTSGSTNAPLEFYSCADREAHVNAARIRGHEWVGMQRGEKEMYFWGSPVELSKQDRLKQVRDWLINDSLTGAFDLGEEVVQSCIEAWLRFRPKCIFCYPSSMVQAINIAEELGIDLGALKRRGLKMVITTAEILGENRERISDALDVPVYDSYGLREVGLIGHECVHQRMHCTEEQLILETIDPHTLEPTLEEGELVVTNVVGAVMPIVRYRTGDMVRLSESLCECGRSLRTITVTGGRMMDCVVTSEGRWLSGVLFTYLAHHLPGVTKLQVRQDKIGEIRLLLVRNNEFSTETEKEARHILRQRLRCDDTIRIEYVDDIPPSPSGKHRLVISSVAERLRPESGQPGPV